jgi:hypothetical protein
MVVLQQAQKAGPDDVHRLKLALIGFRKAKARHEADRTPRDVSQAYISMFEATMWISALDQQLCSFYGGSYKRARDQDEYGAVVNAVRWARDRHAHQLPVTLDEDRPAQRHDVGRVLTTGEAYNRPPHKKDTEPRRTG